MKILSDSGIRDAMRLGDLSIEPYNEGQMQPASYDVRLGNQFIERFETAFYPIPEGFGRGNVEKRTAVADPYSPTDTMVVFSDERTIPRDGHPLVAGQFILVATEEVITLGPNMSAQIVGKSSLARHGLIVESAGFIDAGFSGAITLELAVLAGGVRLYAGMPIAQIVFTRLDSPTSKPYEGKYLGQTGPQIPKYYLNERPS